MTGLEDLLKYGDTGVLIVVMILFFKELRAMGKSRDSERLMFVSAIRQMTNLCTQMVERCQGNIARNKRISTAAVLEAGKTKKGT